MTTNILGTFAMVSALLVTFVGVPGQIRKNWQRKSVEGVSLTLHGLAFLNVTAWFLYGFFRPLPDWFIVWPNLCGMVLFGAVLWQFYAYRGR